MLLSNFNYTEKIKSLPMLYEYYAYITKVINFFLQCSLPLKAHGSLKALHCLNEPLV